MQNKRFVTTELAAIPPTTGINTLVLETTDEHRINYHGIRYQGRLFARTDSGTYQKGYITLLCVPNDQVALSGIFSDNDMVDWNEMIIAVMPWSMQGQASFAAANGAPSIFDWVIDPRTSRTCSKGGKIVAQVTNVGNGTTLVNCLLTSYTTTV